MNIKVRLALGAVLVYSVGDTYVELEVFGRGIPGQCPDPWLIFIVLPPTAANWRWPLRAYIYIYGQYSALSANG